MGVNPPVDRQFYAAFRNSPVEFRVCSRPAETAGSFRDNLGGCRRCRQKNHQREQARMWFAMGDQSHETSLALQLPSQREYTSRVLACKRPRMLTRSGIARCEASDPLETFIPDFRVNTGERPDLVGRSPTGHSRPAAFRTRPAIPWRLHPQYRRQVL